MKHLFSFIVFLVLLAGFFTSYAQTSKQSKTFAGKITVSGGFSFGGNDLFSSTDLVGGPSYQGKGFSGFEAGISLSVLKNLDVLTGFSIIGNNFGKTDAPSGSPAVTSNMNISVFSIPLYAKYHFLKFLFVSGGPVFNINSGDRDLNGIGAGGSFGTEYQFSNGLTLSFGPFIRINGLLPDKNYKLINSGVNIGAGFRF